MSGRVVSLPAASGVPLSKRFGKLEKSQGGGGAGGKNKQGGAKNKGRMEDRNRDQRRSEQQKKSRIGRQLVANQKRNINNGDGGRKQTANKVAKQLKRNKSQKLKLSGAGGKVKVALPGQKKNKQQGGGAGAGGAKISKKLQRKKQERREGKNNNNGAQNGSAKKAEGGVDLDYELDKYRFAAGRGPNPDQARLDAQLEAYKVAQQKAAAAAEGGAAAPAAAGAEMAL